VETGFLWPTKGTGGLKHHNFLIFDGKQHRKIFGSVINWKILFTKYEKLENWRKVSKRKGQKMFQKI